MVNLPSLGQDTAPGQEWVLGQAHLLLRGQIRSVCHRFEHDLKNPVGVMRGRTRSVVRSIQALHPIGVGKVEPRQEPVPLLSVPVNN